MSIYGFSPNFYVPRRPTMLMANVQQQQKKSSESSSPPTFRSASQTASPSSQPVVDNSGQFAFPEFNGKSLLQPITTAFGGMVNRWNAGMNASTPLSGPMPTPPVFQVAQPQFIQPTNSVNPPAYVRPTAQQIVRNVGQGFSQGLQTFSNLVQQHGPMMASVGAGLAGAGAVCPFLGGALAATGGAMLAQQNQNQVSNQQAA